MQDTLFQYQQNLIYLVVNQENCDQYEFTFKNIMCSNKKSFKNICKYAGQIQKDMKNCLRCSFNEISNFQTCDECSQDSVPFIKDQELHIIHCSTDCGQGQFVYKQECISCIHKCQICSNEEQCQVCDSNYYLSKQRKQCVLECDENEYVSQGLQQQKECVEGTVQNCKEYYDFKDKCKKCKDDMVILSLDSEKNECVYTCPPRFYENWEKGSCQNCYNPFCLQCYGEKGSQCLLCDDNSIIQDEQCLKICKPGEYIYNFTQCKQCSQNCKECQLKEYKCTKCHKNQMLYYNIQICKDGETCSEGFYQKEGNQCFQCDIQCIQCQFSAKNCTKCDKNHVLQDSDCQDNCNQGYGLISSNNICLQCEDENCVNCYQNYKICTQCQTGYVILQKNNQMGCGKCFKSCYSCFGINYNECYTCKDEYTYDENEKTCILEIQNETDYLILFISIGIIIIITSLILFLYFKKQKKQQLKKEQLLKNNLLCELEQQYNFQANENIIFNDENKEKFNLLHQQHLMTELQFKQQYKRIKNLGQGSFGVVEQFYDKMNEHDVAIKFFKMSKQEDIINLGLKEAEQIEQINQKSQQYTIKQLSYFIIQCESIKNSIQRYQENNKPKKIQSDSYINFENQNILNQNSQNNIFSINNNQQPNAKSNSTKSHQQSNYSSLFGSIQNDSYTLYLNSQFQQEKEQNKQNQSQNKQKSNSNNYYQQQTCKQEKYDQNLQDPIQIYQESEEKQQQMPQQEQEIIQELAIVFEIADYSLADKIAKKRLIDQPFTKQEIIKFLYNMTSVLYDLHIKLYLSHRDIKPQNILYVQNCWKLADFGMSKFLDYNKSVTNNYTLTGTLNYQSPEQKNNYVNQFSSIPKLAVPLNPFKCDIFSLGITCYEMITLKKVDELNQNQHIMFRSLNKFLKPCIEIYSSEIIDVIELMLQWEPEKRSQIQIIKEKVDFIVLQNNKDKIINLL